MTKSTLVKLIVNTFYQNKTQPKVPFKWPWNNFLVIVIKILSQFFAELIMKHIQIQWFCMELKYFEKKINVKLMGRELIIPKDLFPFDFFPE